MTALLSKAQVSRALQRRTLLKALLGLSAFPFLRANAPLAAASSPPPDDDAIVEAGGWILKRSDLA